MKFIIAGLGWLLTTALLAQTVSPPVRMLALGDSYTIGQSVPADERWPAQLQDSLVARGVGWDTLEIIAVTGWRTDNLASAMNNRQLDSTYNLVSLLIGVNDQFQGGDTTTYAVAFESLLQSAIGLAEGDTDQVMVLSIPDYAYTPFGQGNNPTAISKGIDDFNRVNSRITKQYDVAYYNITPISREGVARPALVASDGLHPSGLQYSEWVSLLLDSLTIDYPSASWSQPVEESLISPNPTSTAFSVEGPISGDIQVWNGQGQLIWTTRSRSISVADWPKGIYVISWMVDDQRTTQQLLVR